VGQVVEPRDVAKRPRRLRTAPVTLPYGMQARPPAIRSPTD
jgi:hypothetical protein